MFSCGIEKQDLVLHTRKALNTVNVTPGSKSRFKLKDAAEIINMQTSEIVLLSPSFVKCSHWVAVVQLIMPFLATIKPLVRSAEHLCAEVFLGKTLSPTLTLIWRSSKQKHQRCWDVQQSMAHNQGLLKLWEQSFKAQFKVLEYKNNQPCTQMKRRLKLKYTMHLT